MPHKVSHRSGFYASLSDEVPEDAEYVNLAYHYNDDNGPTVEAGTLDALGEGLSDAVRSRFERGELHVTDDGPLFNVYLPGPGWRDD